MSFTLFSLQTSIISCASFSFNAIGFSQNIFLPFFAAFIAKSLCV
jgi:hypothetical protein